MSPPRWDPQGHPGPLAPLAFPGDAPGRKRLKKPERLLGDITWEGFGRTPLASWTRFRSQQQFLGDRRGTAILHHTLLLSLPGLAPSASHHLLHTPGLPRKKSQASPFLGMFPQHEVFKSFTKG